MQELWAVADDHPESFLRLILIAEDWSAWGSDGFSKDPKVIADYDVKSKKRVDRCKQAYEGKGIVDVRQEMLLLWIGFEGVRGSPSGLIADMASRKQAGAKIRDYLALFRTVPPNQREFLLKIAINSGDWQLAREVAAQWQRAAPKNGLLLKLRARLEHRAGAWSDALILARQAMEHYRNDQELRDIEQAAVIELRKLTMVP